MYRLIINSRCSSLYNAQSVYSHIRSQSQYRTCSFCKQVFLQTPTSSQFLHADAIRFLSTEPSKAILKLIQKRKKGKKIRKKYTELLQVSPGCSKETKTAINKLKPTEFSLLVEENQLNSNVAPLLRSKKLKKDLVSSAVCASEVEMGKVEDEQLLMEEEAAFIEEREEYEIQEELPLQIPPKKSERNLKLHVDKTIQLALEIAGKSESLSRNLHAYLDLCINCGFLHRGLATLKAYREKGLREKKGPQITKVELFNVMLSGFAAKGNLSKVCEIMDWLKEDSITPSIQTFNACFECAGRLSFDPNVREKLEVWKVMMEEQNMTMNDLFIRGCFVSNQQEKVLDACQTLQPGFKPHIPPQNLLYSLPLLEELNTSIDKEAAQKIPGRGLFNASEILEKGKQQLELERNGWTTVLSVEKCNQPTETTLFYRKQLDEATIKWREVVTSAFQRDLQTLKLQHQGLKGNRQMTLYPFLKVLPVDQYVDTIMQEIRKLAEGSETFSPSMNQLYRELGSQILHRYQIQCKIQMGVVQKMEDLYQKYCKWFADGNFDDANNTRSRWQKLLEANADGPQVTGEDKIWPNTIQISVGKFLYNILLRDVKVDVYVLRTGNKKTRGLPAFYNLYRNQGKHSKEEIKPHPILARLFRGAAQEQLIFETRSLPMLSPPVPWSSVQHGGHIISKTEIIRLPSQAFHQWEKLKNSPPSQLFPALDCLNQLGSIPWRVNEPMLDIVTKMFNSGGSSALDIPEPPSACPAPEKVTSEMSKAERFNAYRKRIALRRRKAEMYSLWCDTLYRLSLANHFRKHIFWLPHNMDFRGRVYPVPPHLNHMGSDMARSILCFAKGEPLGEKGLEWLKIHAINLTGLKKRDSVYERIKFAEEKMPDILDSADNPLTGRKWWCESEEPWQTLACCMEIARAVRSPCPEAFVSHFPIHQDGSCNGLQHYAALGRDDSGAISVNLAPAAIPQDVYSCIAALVERERAKDSENDVTVAKVLEGFVRRKVIKQTVMTTVYGVTRFGARLQIARQLKDIDNFPKEFVWPASTYLVTKTFESLREMFTSAKEIQDWFTESARLISSVRGENVEWVTPLGLPIVQPYSRFQKKTETSDFRRLQEHFNMDKFEKPNVMKQKNAFPPNFIHSLDSSHMMLTSLYCERKGVTFVSVHDCFWTHPSSVTQMNKVCREQFVALHKQPILEELSSSLRTRYSFHEREINNTSIGEAKKKLNHVLTQVPPRGSFDLSQVLDSIYFFS